MIALDKDSGITDGNCDCPVGKVACNHLVGKLLKTREAAGALEKDTRQQSKSSMWHHERMHRVTSSQFGVVLKRREWTLKGLQNFTSQKDLSRVPAIKYGISNEPLAAQRYGEVLHKMGHNAVVSGCGLLVNPRFPWLGASPDRVICDPVEGSYGVVEIKCPYSLREHQACDLAGLDFCCRVNDSVPELKRDHQYYFQLAGQMGVSGMSWGDFVVYGKDFILIERVRFNPSEWEGIREVLDNFYFELCCHTWKALHGPLLRHNCNG
ncbi:uncharacterized protein LOC135393299 [Ornithodoros turicata]|uniref:uncharacterized protein LOC135393299 n=1 Tax=Ornithodoros turicata TaxID=34597 RepID=UPI003139184B